METIINYICGESVEFTPQILCALLLFCSMIECIGNIAFALTSVAKRQVIFMILVIIALIILSYLSVCFRIALFHPIKTVYNAVLDLYKYIKFHQWNNCKTGELRCYVGLFGKGKTLSAGHNKGANLKIGNDLETLKTAEKLIKEQRYSPYAVSVELKKKNARTKLCIRKYIPKGADIGKYTSTQIKEIENTINNYPRELFGGLSTNEYKTLCNINI